MKKTLLLCGALLVMGATSVWAAAGLNITWSATGCYSEAALTSKVFACNVNTGSSTMTASYQLSADQPNFVGIETVVDGQVDGVTNVPDWWQLFNTGSCRPTSLSASADFTTATATVCVDPWGGLAAGGISAWQTTLFPPPPPLNVPATNRVRLKVAFALASVNPLTAGTEYYAFKATINNAKTVGTGACAGCTVPMTFVFNYLKSAELTNPGDPPLKEDIEAPLVNNCLTWNNSTVPCGTVPARNTSWGQVKSLYR